LPLVLTIPLIGKFATGINNTGGGEFATGGNDTSVIFYQISKKI
jgi:hypothetical protein